MLTRVRVVTRVPSRRDMKPGNLFFRRIAGICGAGWFQVPSFALKYLSNHGRMNVYTIDCGLMGGPMALEQS